MDSLKAYVDENVSDLKDFIASVAKKLPMPVKFTTEQKRLGDLGFSVSRSSFWWGQIQLKASFLMVSMVKTPLRAATLVAGSW